MAQKRKTIKEIIHPSLLDYIGVEWFKAKYDKETGMSLPMKDIFSDLPDDVVLMLGRWVDDGDRHSGQYDYEIVRFREETDDEYNHRIQKNKKAALARRKSLIIMKEQKVAEERAEYERLKKKFGE